MRRTPALWPTAGYKWIVMYAGPALSRRGLEHLRTVECLRKLAALRRDACSMTAPWDASSNARAGRRRRRRCPSNNEAD